MKTFASLLLFMLISSVLFAQENSSLDKEKLFDYYQNQKYAEAAIYLKSIYGEDISDVIKLSQLGYCYLMSGNTAEAEKYYAKANTIKPNNLPTLFSLASINWRRGNADKAKLYYGEIVKIDSNNFTVYKLLADILTTKDSLRSVYLIKANKLNPTEADVAYDLADVYIGLQKHAIAYKVLNITIDADSGNIILKKAILPVANFLKKYDEVILSGEKILQVDQDALVIKDVAKAYYFTKNYDKAIAKFKLLETLAMQNEATLYYTSLSYRALKNYPAAIAYTKRTIEEGISTNTSNYYALLGLVYEESDKLALANSAYKKGLEFKAEPNIYYRLALLYDLKYKQIKQASKYYSLYLKSKPNPIKDKDEIKYVKSRMEELKISD
ncbi:tetratricopeptide repeat protein [Pedobacter jejuensis]|uniref:Tetratricopeptide repeat protein n=1 Tax=Pedobacter jejuensis TaxID=1268550 RepID=A0A3N0BPV1_9SPHI|nr:tetratricopeptide repeat protein [Pedobacter jejuensis]RNL51084.1 tetratricopeptide repeat protein [Pedobacter jejuensis]